MILHEKDGDKRTLKLSETRRLQNKLSQKRWRERRKQEKRISKLNGGEEYDGKRLEALSQINKSTLSSTPPHHHERGGGVDASDMIDALALPNEAQREEQSKEDDDPAMTTSLRNIDPQKLSLSQLLSLAYCSPVCSFQPFCQSLHFAKMFVQNANRFGFDLQFIGNSKSESYIAQDWYRHLGKEGKSPHRLAQQLLHESPLTPSTSIRTSESISSTSTESHHPGLLWDRIPDNMHPTEEQLQIKHHPYIDVSFPWPSMRSKLIKMLYTAKVIDYNDFCDACFKAGLAGSEIQQSAFFIWSDDSMDPCAWEVGEEFAKKWWFLLDDEIMKRTNWWRRMRGLPQLSVGRNVSMQEEWIV